MGAKELVNHVAALLDTLEPIKIYEPEQIPVEDKRATREFEITKENEVYFIEAKWLENIISSVDTDDYEALQYFQRVLRSSGIVDKLEEMGINEGDTVTIGGIAFDYVR